MKVGIGFSNQGDSHESGRSVAGQALLKSGIEEPSLVLSFCSGRTDAHAFFQGLQSVVGDAVPIIGGSAIGVITNSEISYSGYIDVASQPGQGTTFSLYFPAVHQAPVETQMTRRDITPVKGLVLVVDDEDMVLETSARMLVTLGFTVQRAGGGREAIEIFRQKAHELDLVVLDMVMPGIGGEEVYRQIKEMKPDARVLISSGFESSGRMIEVFNQNSDRFLRKPFSLGELSEKVQELLCKG